MLNENVSWISRKNGYNLYHISHFKGKSALELDPSANKFKAIEQFDSTLGSESYIQWSWINLIIFR